VFAQKLGTLASFEEVVSETGVRGGRLAGLTGKTFRVVLGMGRVVYFEKFHVVCSTIQVSPGGEVELSSEG
jgi:hypothetical protein